LLSFDFLLRLKVTGGPATEYKETALAINDLAIYGRSRARDYESKKKADKIGVGVSN